MGFNSNRADDDEVQFLRNGGRDGVGPVCPRRRPGVTGFVLFADKLGELLGEAIPAVNAEGPCMRIGLALW